MNFAAALFLAAAAAQTVPAGEARAPDRGAQVETVRVSVTILRPAVLKAGALLERRDGTTPHSQRKSRDGRVTYEFE